MEKISNKKLKEMIKELKDIKKFLISKLEAREIEQIENKINEI